MNQELNSVAFGLIVMGAFFSLGREVLSKVYLRLHGWLTKKKEGTERLQKGVQTYFMLTGMIFTVVGLLSFFGVLSF
jgi:hypothetical protein